MRGQFNIVVYRLAAIAALLGASSGCGIVRFQEVAFTVRDEVTNMPVADADIRVEVLCLEMFKWNAGKVQDIQDGKTDRNGVWKVSVPIGYPGVVSVFHGGYEGDKFKSVEFAEHTLDSGTFEMKLKPLSSGESSPNAPGILSPAGYRQ